jgi:conjugal transfer pilus assembly protein TraW
VKPLLLIICVLYLPFANAHEYGVFGKTYVIAEQDFLEYIEQKIKAMQASGAWDKAQQEFKKRVEAHVMRPDPNLLPRAETERKWLFNPSISAPFDVRDSAGKIIVRKGTVINPLDRVRLSST